MYADEVHFPLSSLFSFFFFLSPPLFSFSLFLSFLSSFFSHPVFLLSLLSLFPFSLSLSFSLFQGIFIDTGDEEDDEMLLDETTGRLMDSGAIFHEQDLEYKVFFSFLFSLSLSFSLSFSLSLLSLLPSLFSFSSPLLLLSLISLFSFSLSQILFNH